MLEDHASYGIMRKDWRARGVLLACMFGAMAWARFGFPNDLVNLTLLAAFLLSSATLWAQWLTREEQKPEYAVLYTLPISRGAILFRKLTLVFLQSILLSVWYGILSTAGNQGTSSDLFFYTLLAMMLSLLTGVVAATVALHARTLILTLALTACIASLVTFSIGFYGYFFIHSTESFAASVYIFSLRALGFSLALAGWLYFAFTRTRLQEQSAGARMGTVFLYGAAIAEIAAILTFTGWHELPAAIFGFH